MTKHNDGHMGRRLTEEEKEKVLISIIESGTITKAAEAIGMATSIIYDEIDRSKSFKKAIEQARNKYGDTLERIMDDRIREGTDKASGILLIFALKAIKPHMYREKVEHQIEGTLNIISGIPRPQDIKNNDVNNDDKNENVKRTRGRPRKNPIV